MYFNKLKKILLILAILSSLILPSTYIGQALETPHKNIYQASVKKSTIVYVTRTGSKYHRGYCRYLKYSKIPMKLSTAKKYYDPCKVCRPPR